MAKLGPKEITASTSEQVVKVHRTDGTPTLFAGLRQDWMSGTEDESGVEFMMTSGAGLGSPYLTISVTFPDGSKVYEFVDMTEFLTDRLNAIVAERA
jgi:hypothetical protein